MKKQDVKPVLVQKLYHKEVDKEIREDIPKEILDEPKVE